MFKIKPLSSQGDQVYKTSAQERHILPPPGTTIFCGRTGSGKTTIAIRLLKDENKLKDYFDKIYVFCMSPCMDLIEHVDQIKEEDMFGEEPDKLTELYERNKSLVKSNGFKNSPHTLFILDDIVQSNIMMNCKALKDIFFGGTHAHCSLWLLTQHWKSCPKKLRMNPHSVILCHGVNKQEIESFTEEWQSPYLEKNDFKELVNYALKEPYSFMFVNATNPNKKEMYRKTFDEILVIE